MSHRYLFAFLLIALLFSTHTHESYAMSHCEASIQLWDRNEYTDDYLIHVDEGIILRPSIDPRPPQFSPNAQYYFESHWNANTIEYTAVVHSNATGEEFIVQPSNRFMFPYIWSHDSTAIIFIYYESGDRHFIIESIDVATNEPNFIYEEDRSLYRASPDNRYIFFPTENGTRFINTVTGEWHDSSYRIDPDYPGWSPDNQWVISRVSNRSFIVINAETGDPHPLMNEPISGHALPWADEVLWFDRSIAQGYAISRWSLATGFIEDVLT